jgi:Flp pilus assembly protein TadG
MSKRRGQSLLEFTFVGIPIIFTLISIFEISRGMWIYHTLANAAKVGVRFSIVHGKDCVPNPPTINNNCQKTVADVAQVIQDAGVGLDINNTEVRFRTVTEAGVATTVATCNLRGNTNGCQNQTAAYFPPDSGVLNAAGSQVEIQMVTPFRSAVAMFWPGSQPVSFAVTDMYASSRDRIQF